MAPLTWRNVDAPSFAASNDLLKYAGQSFNSGFDVLDRTVGQFQDATIKSDSNRLIAEGLKYQDPATMEAALKAGTLTQNIDPRNLNADALNFLNDRVLKLTAEDQAASTLRGTDIGNIGKTYDNQGKLITNATNQFSLDTSQADRARLESQRANQPAALDLITKARAGVMSGDPEAQRLARLSISENTQLLSDAGYTTDGVLSALEGNESTYQTALIGNQNTRLAADWWQAKGVGDDSKKLVEAAIGGTSNANDAIRAIAASGVSPDIKKQAIVDLQANAGAYYPAAIDPMQSLLNQLAPPVPAGTPAAANTDTGFAPGIINNESGGNWSAINYETGSGGRVGHFGRGQFGLDRLDDAKAAGIIPQGMTGEQYAASSPDIQKKVESWHNQDIEQFITDSGLTKYIGQNVGGVPITLEAMKSMAHLGGKNGMKSFLESDGKNNPADINGSSLSAYGTNFGGNPAAVAPSGGIAPVDPSLPIPGTFSTDGNPISNPVPTLPGTAETQAATDLIKRSALADNALSNPLQGVDLGLASKRFDGLSRGAMVAELKKGALADVPSDAIAAAMEQAVAMGMSPGMAGVLLENNLEARDIGGFNLLGLDFGKGDSFGQPNAGARTAARIDMEGVKANYDAYVNKKAGGGQDISPAVARLTAAFQNANVPMTAETLNSAAAQAKANYDQKVQAAKSGKPIDINAAQLEYESILDAINSMMNGMGTGGGAGSVIDQYSRVAPGK